MQCNKKGIHEPFVPGKVGVSDEHDKVITQPYPFGRLDYVVLGKGQINGIKHGVKSPGEKTYNPGSKKGIRRKIVF
jgi:hypothetical protein